MLHAKSIIIDQWATIGSSNLDYLSLFNNLEVDVRLSRKKSYDTVKQIFINEGCSKKNEIYSKSPLIGAQVSLLNTVTRALHLLLPVKQKGPLRD